MLQKESQVVTGASLRKGLVQAIPACVRLAQCAMSMSARGREAAHGRRQTDILDPEANTRTSIRR